MAIEQQVQVIHTQQLISGAQQVCMSQSRYGCCMAGLGKSYGSAFQWSIVGMAIEQQVLVIHTQQLISGAQQVCMSQSRYGCCLAGIGKSYGSAYWWSILGTTSNLRKTAGNHKSQFDSSIIPNIPNFSIFTNDISCV